MNKINSNTQMAQRSSILNAKWLVVEDAELVNESRTGERDSSGQWLKQNCKLESPKGGFSAGKQAIADLYGEDVEMLFMARR